MGSVEFVDFTIREAELSDLDDIVELWQALSIDQLGKDEYYKGDLEFNDGHKQIKESIISNNCGVFVIEYDDAIQGFIEVWINRDGLEIKNNDYAYVLHYYINEKARRIGNIFAIVTRLYKSAENWAKVKGKSYVIADAFEHNQRIIRYLKREGVLKYKTRMVREI